MEFRLAGPVEVVLNGEPVAITAARQEIVLTMLLLEANHVISVSRLVDALWEEAPPRTAKNQIQITVSALRSLLGDPEGSIIVTRSPGYLIRIPDEALDLKRFEQLAADGASAAAEHRRPEAVLCLRSALALWRGPAMDGVASKIVQVAATQLHERRLAVQQTCLELELQLGRHQDIIGDLTALTTEQPLHELIRAQLMLALYRSGRQAEALETFRECREILKRELGLDPCEELRRLEFAILVGDPQLDLPGSTPRTGQENKPGPVIVPGQLPGAIPDLTGREEALEQICGQLSAAGAGDDMPYVPVVALTGRGGAGKTALAVRAAHQVRDAFPDGQLFAQLHGDAARSPADALDQFLRAFGIAPDMVPGNLEARAAMYRSLLAERRVLVVIDDVASIGQLIPLLPGAPTCAAIITTRKRFSGLEGVSQFEVEPLDEQSAIGLLARLTSPARMLEEREAARVLVGLCEGMPLALRIAAAKLVARPHWRIDQIVHRLQDEERRLDELRLDGASIRATMAISYASLDEDGRRLLRRLGLCGATDFSSWTGAPLLDCRADVAAGKLEELVEARLVEVVVREDKSVRFYLHDLVRIYAVERLGNDESPATRVDLARRLLGCWLFLAAEAHRRVFDGVCGVLHGTARHSPLPADTVDLLLQDPLGWFRSEQTALIAAIQLARETGLDELCWDLAATSATLFESGTHTDGWHNALESALDTVRSAGNKRGEAAILCSLGTLELTGQPSESAVHFEKSLDLFAGLSDTHGRALALSGLAFVTRIGGKYGLALSHYEVALAGFKEAGDLMGAANVLKNMAQIHLDRQHDDVAEQLLSEALVLCRTLDARRVTAQVTCELAEIHLRRGQLKQAEESFKYALLTAREVGDITGQAYALVGLGNIRRRHGEFVQAESDLRAALRSANQTGDRVVRGRVLLAVAELALAMDRTGPAMARIDEALRVLGELGSAAVWRARALELVGRLHERAGRASTAAHAWRSAMELACEENPLLAGKLAQALARLGTHATRTDQDPGIAPGSLCAVES
jgi:DNA-binding SARP family transcriptional activator/tetratricopeptide (TPR) repeat protein